MQTSLANLVTLLLGITIGTTMTASSFLRFETLLIMLMGLVAFIFDTAGGVLFAKLLNLFLKNKINPTHSLRNATVITNIANIELKLAVIQRDSHFLLLFFVPAKNTNFFDIGV